MPFGMSLMGPASLKINMRQNLRGYRTTHFLEVTNRRLPCLCLNFGLLSKVILYYATKCEFEYKLKFTLFSNKIFRPLKISSTYVEELYATTSDILDAKFREQIKYDFASCYSEMYFSAALMERGKYIVTHPSDKGPDFFLDNLDRWVEVVTATDGDEDSENSIPQPKQNEVKSYPEQQVILRLSSVVYTKANKLKNDIEKGIIRENQPIIICISGGWLSERIPMHPEGGYPVIAKTVLPIGDLVFWMNRETNTITSRTFNYREGVNKITSNGEKQISTDFFINEGFNHISAVVYSYANAGNPIRKQRWGSDFYTIHNPLAKNKLPLGFIKCGIEYPVSVDENSFTMEPQINHEKS
jgi:hypothetical protein